MKYDLASPASAYTSDFHYFGIFFNPFLFIDNLDWSKLKKVADDNENLMQFEMKPSYVVENIEEKEEISCYKYKITAT